MRLYTVHLPLAAGSSTPAFERAEFVRDGFNIFAFLFNIVWCLWKGLWLGALVVAVVCAAAIGLGRVLQLSGEAQFWLLIVLALLFGLEASSFIRFKLRRRGYVDGGSVAAADLGDAEAIYFARVADEMGQPRAYDLGPGSGRRTVQDVVGLFPEYRGR